MADEGEEEAGGSTFEFNSSGYPDLEGVTLPERRRVWALGFLLECGMGGMSTDEKVRQAAVLVAYAEDGTVPAEQQPGRKLATVKG